MNCTGLFILEFISVYSWFAFFMTTLIVNWQMKDAECFKIFKRLKGETNVKLFA